MASKTFVLISTVAFILSCNTSIKEKAGSAESASLLDSLRLYDMNGQALNMQPFRGKVLFINFWATWCKPCISEMPSIANAQKLLHEKVVFILASAENADETKIFRTNNSFPFLYARIEDNELLNIQALPTTFIFSSKGKLLFSESGARKWDDSSNIKLIHQIIDHE